MICVSIGRTRHRMVIMEHRSLAERGAELVELRLDWLSRQPELSRLLDNRPTPCVVTCRRQSDRGRWKWSEEQRLALLRQAIVDGAEYVDIEYDVADQIRRYGSTRRIISYHNFEQTPEELQEIHARCRELDPDVIKLATIANSASDMLRMLQLVADAEVPTIAFCMGELGLASRILCGKYGAPFTYASFSSERELAPGQLSYQEMRDVYHFDAIDQNTKVYGVLGDPIAQSLSPLIHNTSFRQEGMNAVYLPFRVLKQSLHDTLRKFEWLQVQGYSVTIPHKEAVLEHADHYDGVVGDIGAANTLYRSNTGTWMAANTDFDAAMESIRLGLQPESPGEAELHGKKVLMLGAGGAARAIGLGLVRAGAAVTITNRTQQRSADLAAKLGCQQILWENRGTVFADILVNCTPVGMHPKVDESPFASNWLRDGMLVFDTVYNPENTLLLKEARKRNCRAVSGIEMFVRQAALQFECFTGQAAPVDHMRETLRRSISAVRT